MKICRKISMLMALCCCWVMLSTSANAKVCFVGDPECGGVDSFGSYQDPDKEIGEQCIAAGYTTKRDECKVDDGNQVTDACPYDSNYVTCCGLEYAYDACVYPMVADGKCGNKYKCICDSSKYKYTANGSKTDCKNNSYASGASCAQITYDKESKQYNTSIHFTDCRCDKAAYPILESQCDKDSDRGEKCVSTDNSGQSETRYSYCSCNTSVYPETQNTCDNPDEDKFGPSVTGGYCDDGVRHYKTCIHCSSNGYVAKDLDHVSGNACSLYTGEVKTAVRRAGYVVCDIKKIDDNLTKIDGTDTGKTLFGTLSSVSTHALSGIGSSSGGLIDDSDLSDITITECGSSIYNEKTGIKKCPVCEDYYYYEDENGTKMELTRLEISDGQYGYVLAGTEKTCGYLKCPNGSRYRHLNCEAGYEAKDGVCQPMSCKDVIREFTKAYSKYVLLDDAAYSNATEVIVAPGVTDVSLSYTCNAKTYTKCDLCSCQRADNQDQCINTTSINDTSVCYNVCGDADNLYKPVDGGSADTGGIDKDYDHVVINPVVKQVPCCTRTSTTTEGVYDRGLMCSKAKNYYSVQSLDLSAIKDNLVTVMQQACTGKATIRFASSGTFPHKEAKQNSPTSGKMTFNGVDLDFNYTTGGTEVERDVALTDGSITVAGSGYVSFNGSTVLSNLTGKTGMNVDGIGKLYINGSWKSTGYNYDLGELRINNDLDKVVVFKSGSSRTGLTTTQGQILVDKLIVSGGALFSGIDIIPQYNDSTSGVYVGYKDANNCKGLTRPAYTFVTLYNSKVRLDTNLTSLHICSGSGIGYPNTQSSMSLVDSKGSKISTNNKDYAGILYYNAYYKTNYNSTSNPNWSCINSGVTRAKATFIDENMTYQTGTDWFFCTSSGSNKAYNLPGTRSKMSGRDGSWSREYCINDGDHPCYNPSVK